jgi:AcrR family transcriptional regulator
MTRQPGRKRDEASRQAILEATFALLKEEGFERLSIEGIAARASVGKTTIYRWWASKGVVAVEAFLAAVEPQIAFVDSGSPRNDVVLQMQSLAAVYRGPTGRLVREMIGAAQHDEAMREAFLAGFLEPRREQARRVVRRGIDAGLFRPDVDLDVAIDALWAPIYYRLLVSGASLDDATIAAHAEIVLRGLRPGP